MELQLLIALQNIHTKALDLFFTAVTSLGNAGFIWIIAGLLLLLTKTKKREALLLFLSLLICFLIGNVCLKNTIMRDRPCWLYPEIELLIRIPRDFSFPSGHSMVGFAGALAVYHANKGFGIAALCLAGIIAFSRLYLFVHWPSDVIIGSVIGLAITTAVFQTANYISKHKKGENSHENV